MDLHNEVDGVGSGPHCDVSGPDALKFDAVVVESMLAATGDAATTADSNDSGLFSEATGDVAITAKVDVHAGETGYYTFDGLVGPSPTINVKVGQKLVFSQHDASNWYHPLGFAFYPDGAHGETWGGDERPEVEELDQIQYFKNGARACDATDDFARCSFRDRHLCSRLPIFHSSARSNRAY